MKKVLVVFVFLISMNFICAAIEFDENGKWETTFDCDETYQYEHGTASSLDCDGMRWEGNWFCAETPTYITDAANNFAGSGRGARFSVCDGTNSNSGTIGIIFPSNQPEFWIRHYTRWEEGFAWSTFTYDKQLYIWTDFGTGPRTPAIITGFHNNARRNMAAVVWGSGTNPITYTCNNYQLMTNFVFGWNDIMGGDTSSGEWHSFEYYFKLDDDGTNGIGRIWVDGVLRGEQTNINWSCGLYNYMTGWRHIHFESNQASPIGGPYYVDYDDMVIYNQTPPNRDEHGNPFIGPIGWGESDSSPPTRSNSLPTGNLLAGTTQTIISLQTNKPATCRYSTTAGVSYSSMTNTFSTTGETTHLQSITELQNGITYNYYVRCNDTSGNVNTNDYLISFSINPEERITVEQMINSYKQYREGEPLSNFLTTLRKWILFK